MSRGSVDFARTVIWQSETRLELNLSGYNLSDGQVGEWEKWAYSQHKRALRWTRGRVIAASCDFSKCQLTDYGINIVISVLLKLDVCVERLKLHQNRLTKADQIAGYLLHSQKVVPLLELHLSHNEICDKEASNLLCTFRRTRSSVWLRLEKNLILDPWKMVEDAQRDCPGLVLSHAKRCTKINKAHVVLFSGLFGTNPGPIPIRPRSPPHLTKIVAAPKLKSGSGGPVAPSSTEDSSGPKSDLIVVAPTLNKAGAAPSSAGETGDGNERLHVAPVSVKVPSPSACVKAPPPSSDNVKSAPPGGPSSGIRIQKPWDNIKATPPVDKNAPAARVVLKPASACDSSGRPQQQQQELNAKLAHSLGPPTQSGGYPQTVVTGQAPQSAAALAAAQHANQLAAIAYANQIAYATANYATANATPAPVPPSQPEPFSQAHLSQIIASHAQEKAARAAGPTATNEAAARMEEIRRTAEAAEKQAQAAASILAPTAQASKKVAPVDSKATSVGNRVPPPPPREQRPPSPPRPHGPISFGFKTKNPSSNAPVESATGRSSKSSHDDAPAKAATASTATSSRSSSTRWDQAARRNDEKYGGGNRSSSNHNTGTSKYDNNANTNTSRTKSARGEDTTSTEEKRKERDREIPNAASSEARRIAPTSKSTMPFSKARVIAQQRQERQPSTNSRDSKNNNKNRIESKTSSSSATTHREGEKKKEESRSAAEVMSTTSSRPHRAVLTMIPQKNMTRSRSPAKKREGEREREGGSSGAGGVLTTTTRDAGRVRLTPNKTPPYGDKPPLLLKPNNNAASQSSQPTTPIQVSKSKSLQVSKSKSLGEGRMESSSSGGPTLAKAKAPRAPSDCPPRGWSKQSSSDHSVLTGSSPKRKAKIPVPPKELTPAPKKGDLIISPERGRDKCRSVVSREKSTSAVVLTRNPLLPPSKAMHVQGQPVSKCKTAMVLQKNAGTADREREREREKGRSGDKRERDATSVGTSDGISSRESRKTVEEESAEEREKRERSEETIRAAREEEDEEIARVKAEAGSGEEEDLDDEEKGNEDGEDEQSLVDEFDVEMRRRLAAMMGTTDPADGNPPEDEHAARQSSSIPSHAAAPPAATRPRRPRNRSRSIQSVPSSTGARDRDCRPPQVRNALDNNKNDNNDRAPNKRRRSQSGSSRKGGGASSLDQFYAERNEKKNSPERERNQRSRRRTKSPSHRARGTRGGRDPWRRPRSRSNHRRSGSKRQRR